MTILALNAGSSTLKFGIFRDSAPTHRLAGGKIELTAGKEPVLDAVIEGLAPFGGIDSVMAFGHRIVMGGASFDRPTLVDDGVLAKLREVSSLDPDHLPVEIAIIEAARKRAPDKPQVACFDTAFHGAMPRVSRLLPLPRAYEAEGLRRYGFHGLSCQYLVEELRRVAGEAAARGRVILAHLGSGSSLTAVAEGHSVDTTMSFTPNSGVPMATRSGDLDPGILVHLARKERTSVDKLDAMLNARSGLFGVSGVSGDMRELLAREATHVPSAEAVALFCHSVRKAVGALATTIGGLDTLVFSAGIGESAPSIRARISAGLSHLGVQLDAARNEANAPVISTDASPCTARVIPTDEEAIIVRETLRLVRGGHS